jgi:ABC-type glycerol-3-phosphate transport system permease component
MSGFAWLASVALCYCGAGLNLWLAYGGLKRRRLLHCLGGLAFAALAIGLYEFVPLANPSRLLIAAGLSSALAGAGVRRLLRRDVDWKLRRRRKEEVRQVFLHLIVATAAVVFSLPFVWLISTSLKADTRLLVVPPEWIPRPTMWKNYARALEFLPPETHKGLMYLWNTVYLSALNIAGVLFASTLVAFSFARLRWPGREPLFLILLATMMLPSAVTMIPVFLIFKWLGFVDTLRPLWAPSFFGGAFYIFLLRQFFMTVPSELEDAAKIDGAGFLSIYWRIMLPLIKPALAAVVIFTFMGSWNNFMGPLIYISSPEKMPIAYALQLYQSTHSTEYNLLMAAAAMAILPVILVFFLTQRYFIQGVTLTGLKG